jgi:hypothetical protein
MSEVGTSFSLNLEVKKKKRKEVARVCSWFKWNFQQLNAFVAMEGIVKSKTCLFKAELPDKVWAMEQMTCRQLHASAALPSGKEP